MSKNIHAVILAVAIIAVFAVYLLKTGLQPVADEAPAATPAADNMPVTEGGDDMMSAIRGQMEHLRELEKNDPNNPDILVQLGNIYYDAGMAEQAVEYYDRVLGFKPDAVNVMVDKATMLRVLEKPQEAVDLLREVVKRAPRHEQAWFNLGVIYSADLNDTRAAVDSWKKFLGLNPNAAHADAIREEVARMEEELAGK